MIRSVLQESLRSRKMSISNEIGEPILERPVEAEES